MNTERLNEVMKLIYSYIECYKVDVDVNITFTKEYNIRIELESLEDVNSVAGTIFNDLRDEVFANGYITNDVLKMLKIEVNYEKLVIYIKKND